MSSITSREPRRGALLLVVALTAVVVVAAVVGTSLALRNGGSDAGGTSASTLPDAAPVLTAFRGLPQRGLALGSATAPTTLVEYLDLQCPWCGEFARETFPGVVTRFVRTGRVRVELRPLDFVGSDSVRGRNALFAAAQRNKAFQFVALLYAHQGAENTGWLSADMVRAAASSIPGLDAAAVAGAGTSPSIAAWVERQRATDGVTGVPTFFVRRTGSQERGTMLVNPSAAQLATALGAS